MQQIERVGVIALLLLVVTMATVALWGDGKSTHEPVESVAVDQETTLPDRILATRPSARGQRQGLPLNTTPARSLPARTRASRAVSDQSFSREAELLAYAEAQMRTAPERFAPGSRKRKTPRTVSSSQAAAESTHSYTIRRGDSLSRIARVECGDSKALKRIMALNGITNPDRIREGQVLVLPGDGARGATAQAARPSAAPSNSTYVVKPGDSLSAISQRTLGTSKRWEELMALNGISDPTRIHVGQVLKLPGVAHVTAEPILLASAQVTR
ncbi:MAG: LysM peptidoglycan-binding domain-containing protein [Planctomycetota bacterium]|jgi:nucleoid-associated protein YgaU|nr:LysM peptidoglycan-binding domain-containing protein [Planctomycetota bacterium]